jgi:hypothetical protein
VVVWGVVGVVGVGGGGVGCVVVWVGVVVWGVWWCGGWGCSGVGWVVGWWLFPLAFEHSKVCTLCDLGHLQFIDYIFLAANT